MVRDTLTIGRDPDCDIVLADRQVSRFHARVGIRQGKVYLEDLGSKNGTFHHGQNVNDAVTLHDGDQIQIALIQSFTFFASDATMPLEGLEGLRPPLGGKLFLDSKSRRVWIGSEEIAPPLSVSQFKLLLALFEQQGRVVSRYALMVTIWGEDELAGVSDQALDALIRRLRDRLREFDRDHEYIVTVRGHGLRLENLPG